MKDAIQDWKEDVAAGLAGDANDGNLSQAESSDNEDSEEHEEQESADDMSDEGQDHSDVPGVEESNKEQESSAATGFASFECAAHALQSSLQTGLSVRRIQTLLKAGKILCSTSTIVPMQQRLSGESTVRISSQRRYVRRNVSQDRTVVLRCWSDCLSTGGILRRCWMKKSVQQPGR